MPKHPDIILSLKAARERDKDTLSRSLARGHDVAAGLFPVRHRPGWHPASDPVVGLRAHAPDVYRGRDYAALTEAAKRKPRTEDDVLREKFGGGGTVGAAPRSREGEKTLAAPSSDDLYEPVGTMPMVGDRYVLAAGSIERSVKHGEIRVAQFQSSEGVDCWRRECFDHTGAEGMRFRILKRKPTTAPEASVIPRAWKCPGFERFRGLDVGDKSYYRWGEWRVDDRTGAGLSGGYGGHGGYTELPPAEAMALWAECKNALGIKGTGDAR